LFLELRPILAKGRVELQSARQFEVSGKIGWLVILLVSHERELNERHGASHGPPRANTSKTGG
jgi:hypothetical protein